MRPVGFVFVFLPFLFSFCSSYFPFRSSFSVLSYKSKKLGSEMRSSVNVMMSRHVAGVRNNWDVPLRCDVTGMLNVPLVGLQEANIMQDGSCEDAEVEDLVAVKPEIEPPRPPLLRVLLCIKEGPEEVEGANKYRPMDGACEHRDLPGMQVHSMRHGQDATQPQGHK